jgi:hypothetical protein
LRLPSTFRLEKPKSNDIKGAESGQILLFRSFHHFPAFFPSKKTAVEEIHLLLSNILCHEFRPMQTFFLIFSTFGHKI